MMHDHLQQILGEILQQCGTHLCHYPDCFAVLLGDNYKDEEEQRTALMLALKMGLVTVLFNPFTSFFQQLRLARRLTKRLHKEVGMDRRLARWAIQTWTVAVRGSPVQGTPAAQFYLGWLSHLGEDVEQNFETAAAWYRRAAKRGHSLAQHNLDTLYRPRQIIRQLLSQYGTVLCHYPDAFEVLFREKCPYPYQREVLIQALTAGVVTKLLNPPPDLSRQALFGNLIQHLEETGLKPMLADWTIQSWYVALYGQTQAGQPDLQFYLGELYYQGEKVRQNFQNAAYWYQLAATQGHPLAQCMLGIMYANGQGVTQNYQAAEQWYRQATAQHNATAQNNLGLLYFYGHGVSQNYQVATTWIRLAADQGDVIAQYNLGVIYANGRGVPPNYETAVKWLRLAAAQGDEPAQQALTDLGALVY